MAHVVVRASGAASLLVFALSACLPATNPYDPAAPAELQAPGSIRGWVVLPDVAANRYAVSLLDAAGRPVRGEDGSLAEVQTRRSGDDAVPGLEDAVPGSFHFPQVRPGTYIVRFDATANGRVDITSAEVRGIEVGPGEDPEPVVLAPQIIPAELFAGGVDVVLENASPGDLLVVTLERLSDSTRAVLVASGAGTVSFDHVAPGDYRVLVTGEGYAPATSARLTVASEVISAHLTLLTLGPLFTLTDFDGPGFPLAPFLPEDRVRDPLAPAGTITAHVLLDAGLVLAQSPGEALSVEVRVGEEAAFDAAPWSPAGGEALPVSLDAAIADGPRTILGQLRICFEQRCTCPDPTGPGEACPDPGFREPLTSGLTELSVVVDRQPPRAVLAEVGGVPRVSAPEGAGPGWVQSQPVSCARFGSPICDEAGETEYRAAFLLELFDEAGRVYGHDSTVDDEEPPATPAATTGLGALVTVSSEARPIARQDGARVLRLFAWDAAGNVGPVETRELVVDVTPIELDSPALDLLAGVVAHPDPLEQGEVVPGAELLVDVLTLGEAPARWRLLLGDTAASASGSALGAFVPWTGPTTLTLDSGAHLDPLPLLVEVEDGAGNRTTQLTPRTLTLFREGDLTAQVVLEGETDVTGTAVTLARSGAPLLTAQVGNAGTVDLGGPAPATLVLAADGTILGEHLPIAVSPASDTEIWTIQIDAPPPWGSRTVPIALAAATRTDAGAVSLVLPRGSLRGRFVLAGQAGTANNSGIQVSLLDDNGQAVAGAATLADGSWRFDDVPVGDYSVVGVAVGHLASTVAGITVVAEETYQVLPDPIELTVLSGDFTLCAATGPLVVDCAPVLYTREPTVQVGGIDLTGFAEYRVSTTAFAEGDPSPPWSTIDTLVGGEIEAPQVSFPGGDDRYTVYLQLRIDETNAGSVLSSDIIYDTTPPTGLGLTLDDGAGATLPGFTRQLTAVARPVAAAAGADEAPLASHRVVFADAQPGALPAQKVCPVSGSCTVNLEDADEGVHTAWSFSCDLAGNCTAPGDAVSAAIVLDTTPPKATHGAAFHPVGADITAVGPTWYTRTASYSMRLDVGTAQTDLGGAVLDLGGAAVPDVTGYRFGFNPLLTDAVVTTLAPVVPAGGSRDVTGAPLPPTDGTYVVYGQLVDGAGNATDLNTPTTVTIVLDSTDPTVTFTLESGAATTRDTTVDFSVVENAVDPVVRMWVGVDENFNPGQYEERTFPLADSTFVLPAGAAPAGDGSWTVYARFFDQAGNAADRSDSIVLDRTPPVSTFLACQDCTTVGGVLYAQGTDLELDALAQDNLGQVSTVAVDVEHQATGWDALTVQGPYDGSVDIDLVVLNGATPASPAGLYTITVRFSDPAGNVSAPATLVVAYDPTPPSAPTSLQIAPRPGFARITSPAPCSTSTPCLNDPRPILAFLGSTDNLDTSLRYRIEVAEGGDFTNQVVASAERDSALPFLVPSSLPDGGYGFRVTALDDAGNAAPSAVASFTIDTTAPDAPSLLPPLSPVSANVEATVDIEWVPEAGASAYDLQMALDGVGFGTPLVDVTLAGTSRDVRADLVSGPSMLHHVRVRAVDALGNASPWTFAQLVHDDVAPCTGGTPTVILVGTDPANLYSNQNVITVGLTCPGGGQQDMKLACDGTVDTESLESFASVASCALPDGVRTVDAEVFDAAGNRSAAAADTITIDGDPPTVPRFAESGGTTAGTSFAVGPLALPSVDSGAGLATPSYELHWPLVASGCPVAVNARGWCPWDGVTGGTLSLVEGENRIRVRAVDRAINLSDDDQLVVVRDTTPPAAVVSLDADAGNGEITVTWSPPADVDVEGYEVFYGPPTASGGCTSTDVADYTGQAADQGVSPIDVGANTVLRLTGLAAGTPVCVGVRAYDAVNDGAFAIFGTQLLPNEIAPRVVGTWTPPSGSAVRAVAMRDDIVFAPRGCASSASCANTGFSALDVSDPDNPTEIGSCSNGAYTGMFDISILGNWAYVANGPWIEIIDISDPTTPDCSYFLTLPDAGASASDWGIGVATSPGDGNGPGHLVVAALDEGVYTYTLSTPRAPAYAGQYKDATAGAFRAHAVSLQGDYAYVAHNGFPIGAGVRIVDISNLAAPSLAGTTIDVVPTWDVDVSGSRVMVAMNGGLYVFDIPDPTVAASLSYADAVATRAGQPTDVLFHGPYAYLTDEDGFNGRTNLDVLSQRNLDEADADLPLAGRSPLSSTPLESLCSALTCGTHPNHELPQARRFAISGLYIVEANRSAGVLVRRLARPITLEEVYNQPFASPVQGDPGGNGAVVYGHRVLFGRNGHLVPVDFSDAETPVQLTPTSIDNATTTLERVNDRFIIGGGTGFMMVRPNPDDTFTVTATWSDGAAGYSTKRTHTRYPLSYVVDGDDTYYASNARLRTVDLRSLSTLSTVPLNLGAGFWYADLASWRQALYVTAAGGSSVAVVNLTSPGSPSVQTLLNTTYSAYGVDVHRGRLLVSHLGGMSSWSVATPLAPASPISLGVDPGRWIAVSGEYLVGADQPQGVVVNLSDMGNPTLIGYGGNISLEMNVLLFGKHAVLTDRHDLSVITLE